MLIYFSGEGGLGGRSKKKKAHVAVWREYSGSVMEG